MLVPGGGRRPVDVAVEELVGFLSLVGTTNLLTEILLGIISLGAIRILQLGATRNSESLRRSRSKDTIHVFFDSTDEGAA